MHHTDRTQLEANTYMGEAGYDNGEYAYAAEVMNELVNPYTGEINQDLELTLAAELLSVQSEAELDQFLGKFFKSVGRGISRIARSGVGRALGGALKTAAKVALPFAARAAGGALNGLVPGAGLIAAPALGGIADSIASNLEFEGPENEDSQFEIARRIVRMGVDAAQGLNQLPEGEYVSEEEILAPIAQAAQRYLPNVARAVINGAKAAGAIAGSGGASGNISFQAPGVQFNAGGSAQGGFGAGASTGRWVRTPKGVLILGI
ncbi:MAG TPA: hypothetical protein VD971_08235 [Phycisphaerales bacterium]|nr:hypothetical protein [Phycisphaerales bacterium]